MSLVLSLPSYCSVIACIVSLQHLYKCLELFGVVLHSCEFSKGVKSYCVFHFCHFRIQITAVLLSMTFSCASYICYSTWSKANTFVMHVTAVLLFCYCELCVMVLPQYDYLKQLIVWHESYHSDDYFPEQFMCFLPSVGYALMTSILYFPLNHVEVSTGFVWLMIGTLYMVRPSAIILCKRRVLCFGFSFVVVILYVSIQYICTKQLLSVFMLHELVLILFSFM